MIFVRLMGGLGNQMFQYAAGRRMSLARQTELVLDDRALLDPAAGDTPRKYELGAFGVKARLVTEDERAQLALFETGPLGRIRGRLFSLVAGRARIERVVQEHGGLTASEFLEIPDHSLLSGYWQSETYFADIGAVLAGDFSLRQPLSAEGKELHRQIQDSEAVALHVRRGDYVTNPRARACHGLLPPAYYRRAIARIAEYQPNARVFVFSDDPHWCRNELDLSLPAVHVPARDVSPAEDLWLMSRCRHAVLANSSFSWWGAWLQRNPDGLVIAPSRWFADARRDASRLYCPNWTLMDVDDD
ncbi:MAG: alpha-1,2-fucosyltransferase [Deltaproteobacteria bacterium]|nr:MAG: alpha-1,2-fucosyltransferase [Deltaproteobacteria bacterium]